MARRLSRIVSVVLSYALVAASVGFDAQSAAAQTFTGRAATVAPVPQLGPVGVAPAASLTSPVLPLNAAVLPAASLAISAAPAPTPSAAMSAKAAAAMPALAAVAQPNVTAAAASAAGRDLENVLTGAQPIAASADAVSAVPSAIAPAASLSAASAPSDKTPDAVPAAAPAPTVPKTVDDASSYYVHRWALKAIAGITGAVFSLPQAGPAITAKAIASAADKQLVVSDYDDTLAAYNAVLPESMIDAIRAIRKAGKHFAVVSDRSDEKRPGSTQLTVFESLASLPEDVREGMYVAANSGGKLYQYRQGVPVKIWEAPGLDAGQLEKIKAAAAATDARLGEIGVERHPGDSLNPNESFNTYGYAMMIKAGTDQVKTKAAAAILGEELAKQGLDVEVNGRIPKDVKNPPYLTFSIITKKPASARIAAELRLDPSQAVVTGDMMYVPRKPTKTSKLNDLGLELSGLPIGETGNETDRNMAAGLPGALVLGVGQKMDPRIENGWNLAGHGPDVTLKILQAVASKPAAARGEKGAAGGKISEGWKTAGAIALFAGLLGVAGFAMYAFIDAIAQIITMGEQLIRDSVNFDREGFMLGAGLIGMAGMLIRPNLLADPNETYAAALKKAGEIAVELGYKAADVKFMKATSSLPVFEGAQWHYTFAVANAQGGNDLIDVDFASFLGGAPDSRTRVYKNAPLDAGAVLFPMSAMLMKRGVTMSPESALASLRRAEPSFGARAGVSLTVQAEAVSNDQDAWYTFYDDKGNVGSVNGRTGEVRVTSVVKAAPAKPSGLTTAVEPNTLYGLALANIIVKAAESGVSAGDIRLLSAVHETRTFNGAWVGDEWRFFFGWGGERGGIEYMVPARRTMITETMMDAFEPELKGTVSAERLKDGIAAGLFDAAVKVTPDAALKGVDGVTRVSLLPRVEPVSGDKDLWYSLQDSGDELASVNARTGEVRRSQVLPRASAARGFIAWLIGAALVVAVYGALYWAFTHAPAAAPQGLPDGYHGPIPSIDDVFRGMGGVLGLGMLAGTVRRAKKAKLTDDEIRSAAAGVIAYKGRPWSATEYNSVYYPALESLKARGATKAQLALFEKLCAEAPVKGGSFNPWSGD